MVVNFRACRISPSTRKLAQTSTLKKKQSFREFKIKYICVWNIFFLIKIFRNYLKTIHVVVNMMITRGLYGC
jgi:uncharacterized membrane protein